MRINRYFMPVTVISTLVLSVAIASVAGLWKTAAREDIMEKIERGMAKAEDIKGWMTLEEVSKWFDVPLAELYAGLNLDKKFKPSTEVKELEKEIPDFETDVVREFVEKYHAGGKAPVIKAPVPQPTKDSIAPIQKTDDIKEETPSKPSPSPVSTPAPAAANEEKSSGSGYELTAQSTPDDIKGRMTLKEIGENFRISLPELISRLGLPAGVDIRAPLRDYLEAYGLSITTVRDEVRAMLQK